METRLAQWLAVLLDQLDYTSGACAPTEMVAAVLPREVIAQARAVLNEVRGNQPKEKIG
ncbi:MAG: hypothetical protein ACREIS_14755 [Nitrospiraceae bacterium]